MKRIFTILLFLLSLISHCYSQKSVFFIYGELNPTSKTIDGLVDFVYVNKTNKPIKKIYFNLWANAFNNKNKQFAKDILNDGKTEIYFAKENELGGYQKLYFFNEKDTLDFNYLDEGKENCKINLKNPLKTGDSIRIKINYTLKIPKMFYDIGYNKNQLNMIYWYPTPALYDKNKWFVQNRSICNHLISQSYNFSYILRVPQNYTIAATGILLTPAEIQRVDEIIKLNNKNIFKKETQSSPIPYKTIKYQADNINDVIWIANPNFTVTRYSAISGNKKIPVYFFYESGKIDNDDISFMFEETKEAVKNISSKLGEYPYDKINIILSAKNNENATYPDNIIYKYKRFGFDNDDFIYFINSAIANNYLFKNHYDLESNPGILANLPELVSYNITDSLRNTTKKEQYKRLNTIKDKIKQLNCNHNIKIADYGFSKHNCNKIPKYLGCYNLIALNYFEQLTGKNKFYNILRQFINDSKDKIFDISDFRLFFEKKSGKDLSWFFDAMLKNEKPFGYSIKNSQKINNHYEITIENKGNAMIPFEIGSIKNDSIIELITVNGFGKEKKIILKDRNQDKIVIDPRELYFKNKGLKTKIFLKKRKLLSRDFFTFHKKGLRTNILLPVAGYNANDGFMPGIFITETKNNNYLTLLYGIKSKALVGMEHFERKMLTGKYLLYYGLNAQRFHKLNNEKAKLKYLKISPYISIFLKEKTHYNQKLKFKFSLIKDEEFGAEGIDNFFRYNTKLIYTRQGKNPITPYNIKFGIEHQYYKYYKKNQYLKFNTTLNASYMYKKDRYITMRIYAATFIFNSNINSTSTVKGTLGLIGNGQNDYLYEHFFINRSAQSGFWSHQIDINTGGFKTAVSSAYGLGQSNKYIAAVNMAFDLPVKIGIKPFLDLGIYGYLPTVNEGYQNKFLYSGGIMLQIFRNNFEIYLPLINSKEIENIYKEKPNYFNRLSFMINLDINTYIKFQ